MPFIEINQPVLSDLVVHEADPKTGYARRVVNVNTTTAMPQGTIVFRAKNKDQTAPFAVLATPSTELIEDNEFAVVFGDKFSHNVVVQPAPAGVTPAVSFVRGEVQLKDAPLLKVNNITRDSAEHKAMLGLLENQGIIVLKTLGA